MDINQTIKEAIDNLNNLLDNADDNDLGELKESLKSEYSIFVSRWNQCDRMTQLNYNELTIKTNGIADNENMRFYIGYTANLSDYLWTTDAKSNEAKEMIANGLIIKTHTYYTHLAGVVGEDEHTLIGQYIDHERCLNVDHNGKKSTTGIVYVLVYTQVV